MRNSQKKLCVTGIILKSFYLCVKVRIISIGLSFTNPLIAYLSMSWCSLAAQRQIGETSLNETSSRSHQILRLVCFVFHCKTFRYCSLDNDMIYILILFIYCFKILCLCASDQTIESSAREFLGNDKSSTLAATVV